MIISGVRGSPSWDLSSCDAIEKLEAFSMSDLRLRVHSFRSRRRNMVTIKTMHAKERKAVCPVSWYALRGVRTAEIDSHDNDFIRIFQRRRPRIFSWRSMFIESRGPFQISDIYVLDQRTSLDTTRGSPTSESPTSLCNVETRLDLKHHPESGMIRYFPENQTVGTSTYEHKYDWISLKSGFRGYCPSHLGAAM